ncbi:MAG: Fic family protein [Thermomicrobiales bacterium]
MFDLNYLTVADVIAIYDRVMLESDQMPAALVREDALQRAVHHPRVLAHYEGASLAAQAVDLALELALAHAWVDGNKRISVRSFEVFLELNHVATPDADRKQFIDDFIDVVGAKPEERSELLGGLIGMVQRWVDAAAG